MKTDAAMGVVVLLTWALAGCSGQDDVPIRARLSACDDGRPTTLQVARDVYGVTQAVADSNGGFLLYGSNTAGNGVARVDHAGNLVEVLEAPRREDWIEDVSPTADGGTILASVDWNLGPTEAASVTKMSPAWSVAWRIGIDAPGASHLVVRALPDGGAIVAGASGEPNPQAEGSSLTSGSTNGAFWARLSGEGDLVWEHRVTFDAGEPDSGSWWADQTLVVGPNGLRFVVGTANGMLLISSDLDGQSEQQQLLDTRLALRPIGAAALPDGRLAVLSDRYGAIVTMIDPDGHVAWEESYGREHGVLPFGIATNTARGEILLSGASGGQELRAERTWMMATDFDGMPTWSLERQPMDLVGADGNVREVDAQQGPPVIGLAVAPDGTALGAGYTGFQMTYFAFGAGGCQ